MKFFTFKVAIAIISFNRPHYLSQCIKSLEVQSCLNNTDFFLFQDGAFNYKVNKKRAEQKDIDKCIKIFNNSFLPNKICLPAKENIGLLENHHRAYQKIFDELKYDVMIVTEDDLVYNKDWLRVTRVLIKQFWDIESVATIQASCQGQYTPNQNRKENYKYINIGIPNWLGFAIWRNRWERMKPFFEEYRKFMQQFDYIRRDNLKIRKWYKDFANIEELTTSQDRAKDWAAVLAGMSRVFTVVNRAKYIGEYGVHGTPANYRRTGYDKMSNERIEGDKTIEYFILHKNAKYRHPLEFVNQVVVKRKMIH